MIEDWGGRGWTRQQQETGKRQQGSEGRRRRQGEAVARAARVQCLRSEAAPPATPSVGPTPGPSRRMSMYIYLESRFP